MASYVFLTTWCLDAPIEAVFEVLDDSAGYPRWWKGVQGVELLEPGDDFAWNHDVLMRQGGEGLAAELGSRLLLHD